MALITKVGGPTNTNTLQMTNRRANNPEEAVEQQPEQNIANVLTSTPESEYISSISEKTPEARQATRPMLSDEEINAELTDQMGAPLEQAAGEKKRLTAGPQFQPASISEELSGQEGVGPLTPAIGAAADFGTPEFQKMLEFIGGKTEFYKMSPEEQKNFINVSNYLKDTGGVEEFYRRGPQYQEYIKSLARGGQAVSAETMQKVDAASSAAKIATATSPQTLNAVQQSIQNVNINCPFPPQVDIKTDDAEEMYMGNLYSLSLKQAYQLKKQATVDAASRGMGRENLNEAYNKIDSDVFTAFQIAQNEFLNANIQRKFEAEQAEKGRIFTSRESEKQREFEKIFQAKGYEYEMLKTKYTTEEQIGIEQMKIDAAKLENESQRLWESSETLKQMDFQTLMQASEQEFNMKLALFDADTQKTIIEMRQEYDRIEAEKNKIFAKEERMATQSWQTLESLRGEDLQKFMLGQDIGYKEWATQFDAQTQRDLQIMRDETQKLLLDDAQAAEAFQKMEDRDLQKFLSGQQLDFAKMEMEYGRETAVKLQELQEKWGITQLELKHEYTTEEAEQAYQYDMAMNATNQQWEDYMSTKTFDQQLVLEDKRIAANYSLQSLQQTFQAAENLSDRQLNILLSNNKADLERELATANIANKEKLFFAQLEWLKFENSLDREQKDAIAQLDSKDRYAILEREMNWKSVLMGQTADIMTKANEIKMAFDKEILGIEMSYKWASMTMDDAVKRAELQGYFTPPIGWQKDAQGNLIKDANGMPTPIYAKDKNGEPITYITLEKAKTMANIDLEKSKLLGYLVETDAQGNTVYVKDENGNKITTLTEREFQQQIVEFEEKKTEFKETLNYNKEKDKQTSNTSLWESVFANILSDMGGGAGKAVGGAIGSVIGTAVGGPVGAGIGGALGGAIGDLFK